MLVNRNLFTDPLNAIYHGHEWPAPQEMRWTQHTRNYLIDSLHTNLMESIHSFLITQNGKLMHTASLRDTDGASHHLR